MSAVEKQKLDANVTIVDGKIILSLPNAYSPVVWQMDLEKAQSAAFTVKQDSKTKRHVLILKSDDSAKEEIAEFEDKDTAVQVLMETSSVMQNAHGKIRAGVASNGNTPASNAAAGAADQKKEGGSDKTGAILAVLLVVILIAIWAVSASIPSRIASTQAADPSARQSNFASAPTSARELSGVAVSADDFLSNR